jgi:hypothetical protein
MYVIVCPRMTVRRDKLSQWLETLAAPTLAAGSRSWARRVLIGGYCLAKCGPATPPTRASVHIGTLRRVASETSSGRSRCRFFTGRSYRIPVSWPSRQAFDLPPVPSLQLSSSAASKTFPARCHRASSAIAAETNAIHVWLPTRWSRSIRCNGHISEPIARAVHCR